MSIALNTPMGTCTFGKTSLTLTTLVLAGLATSQPAAAASLYSISDLGSLNPSATGFEAYSTANGINNTGQVVGSSITPSTDVFRSHAFRTAPNSAINPMTDDLATLGGNSSSAYDINDSGQVVGKSNKTIYGDDHAFLWNSTSGIQDLGTLGGSSSVAYGINNSGQVVGTSETAISSEQVVGEFRAFVWNSTDGMQDLGTLSGFGSVARDINNSEQVVGDAGTTAGDTHAFFYNGRDPLQDLGTLGGQNSRAFGINDSGQVVGTAETGATYNPRDPKSSSYRISHAFLYSGSGSLQDLGTLGGPNSYAYDINDSGQVVGTADTPDGFRHPFLYSDGKMIDLYNLIPDSSGWVLAEATGINNSGQIVGTGTIQDPQRNYPVHAFLLTPVTSVPEPSSALSTLAFGAFFGAVYLLKRKHWN
jgi:probable HAF family extracellular repeat protein